MPTAEEYCGLPIEARLRRLDETPVELERAISGKTDKELSVRPDASSWAAKKIVCDLQDVEKAFQIRFHAVVALDEPRILVFAASVDDLAPWRIGGPIGHPLDPDRWAAERQYLRNDTHEALAAFRRRRSEVLVLLRSLSPAEWQRGGVHLSRGRLTPGRLGRQAPHERRAEILALHRPSLGIERVADRREITARRSRSLQEPT